MREVEVLNPKMLVGALAKAKEYALEHKFPVARPDGTIDPRTCVATLFFKHGRSTLMLVSDLHACRYL